MKKAKSLLKNLLLLKNSFLTLLILLPFLHSSQIANYVNNGGFEDIYNCALPNQIHVAKYWRSVDSVSAFPSLLSTCSGMNNAPLNGNTYQWPRSGNNYALNSVLCEPPACSVELNRLYLRNRLKQNLQSGHTYCVKFYANICNTSSYGSDGFAAYFGDNTLDTINKPGVPLTYLVPQVQNTNGNIITDTLNWILITGTFVANGTEKHLLIGNFKSDAATTKTIINVSTSTLGVFTDVCIDDVSCIDIDLPAFAGPDVFCIPGNTVYVGRPQDVGIDKACMWYKLPNMTNAIDTAAGIWVSPVSNSTYVVKQDICGVIKYDTVVVVMSGAAISETESLKEKLNIYPVPANAELNINFTVDVADRFKTLSIFNSLGQLLREEEIKFTNQTAIVKTANLTNGVYFICLTDQQGFSINKRFVIAK